MFFRHNSIKLLYFPFLQNYSIILKKRSDFIEKIHLYKLRHFDDDALINSIFFIPLSKTR